MCSEEHYFLLTLTVQTVFYYEETSPKHIAQKREDSKVCDFYFVRLSGPIDEEHTMQKMRDILVQTTFLKISICIEKDFILRIPV